MKLGIILKHNDIISVQTASISAGVNAERELKLATSCARNLRKMLQTALKPKNNQSRLYLIQRRILRLNSDHKIILPKSS